MWFEVDKDGLAKILERRGKEFVVYELIQNGWDQQVTRVDVTLRKEPNSRWAVLTVEDDDPNGFADLAHAWTLFAESEKKGNAQQRGRFNLGEKMVLAMCAEAEVISTTGAVRFDNKGDGRHRLQTRRERGSIFRGRIKLTTEDVARCAAAVRKLIPPAGVITTFNGEVLTLRQPLAETTASLRTEIADADGMLRQTTRKTELRIYKPLPGETGTLYELGIPVVETGDDYHVDIGQKVPLNLDRDNVSPGYLRTVRSAVLNAIHKHLSAEQANGAWVRDAMDSRDIEVDAARSVISRRFGDRSVAFDPSDPEANKIAVLNGYTVVHGRQMSRAEWAHARTAGMVLPAGQVTPSNLQSGKAVEPVPRESWTAREASLIAKFERIAKRLVDCDVEFAITDSPTWLSCGQLVRAAYSPGHMIINRAAHAPAWWGGISEGNLFLLIHELAHHYAGDHLSRDYYDALTSLGARLALAATSDQSLLA
jgi:hypothetical protein